MPFLTTHHDACLFLVRNLHATTNLAFPLWVYFYEFVPRAIPEGLPYHNPVLFGSKLPGGYDQVVYSTCLILPRLLKVSPC